MRPAHLFVFVFFFALDVRVRASNDFLERPVGCLKNVNACALQTKKSAFHFNNAENEFHLGPSSLILRHSLSHLEFISGTLWTQNYEKMQVTTIYGNVDAKSGPFWVLGDKDKIWVRNVNADLTLHLRDGRKLELPIGFQIWLSGLDTNGKSTVGIPEIIPVEEHIRVWSYLFPGTKEQFKAEVAQVKGTWGSLAERSSQLYLRMSHHQADLATQHKNKIQRRELAVSEQKKQIRALYYEKAFWR